jgi:oligopeptide/dipeptide ABC transporter ATP-binding protein
LTSQISTNLLEVQSLKTYFFTEDGVVKAVDGVEFSIKSGEVLGLVGESGCGKSVTSLSIMGLIGKPGKIVAGKILFDGQNLMELPESEMTHIRGNRISMIFQQPQSSLNPVFKVGDQVAEVLRIHQHLRQSDAWARAVDLLRLVGIPDAEKKAHSYPHEMSGGQAQRVMIAMALALKPRLLIADEPTTALDVTIQAQILDLMRGLRTELDTAVILITHDLGVIAEMADNVAVMYAGRIVEETDVITLFARPLHPYTQGLIASIPILGKVRDRLEVIPGNVPDLVDLPPGCKFASRCKSRLDHKLTICEEIEPEIIDVCSGNHPEIGFSRVTRHSVRCWIYSDQENSRPTYDVNGKVSELASDQEKSSQ